MSKMIDLTGQRFGRLTVIGYSGHKDKSGRLLWTCRCDCGKVIEHIAHTMKSGRASSCGCYNREAIRARAKHGWCVGGKERLYNIWHGMIARCTNTKDANYYRYGGRGITVCGEWINNYYAFREWAYANGYDENAGFHECTLDRRDNNKGYSPENCRFVPMSVQVNNMRSNRMVTYKGDTLTIADMARKYGLSYELLFRRLRRGWSIEDAIELKKGSVWDYGRISHV